MCVTSNKLLVTRRKLDFVYIQKILTGTYANTIPTGEPLMKFYGYYMTRKNSLDGSTRGYFYVELDFVYSILFLTGTDLREYYLKSMSHRMLNL